jgi:type II secretory pathway component PulJ
MATAYILLHATISCPWEALIGLLNTLIPALLAWLAARSYFKVAEKDQEVKTLTVLRNELDGKMGGLNADLTNVRLSLSKAEAEL